jgi:cytosine/creatinine deaminase
MITIPASRSTTRYGVSPAMGPDAETYEGYLGFPASRGVEIVLVDDPDCKAPIRESQQRSAQVWSEDIGGR